MSSPTNLTERLAYLRQRKENGESPEPPAPKPPKRMPRKPARARAPKHGPKERRLASDFFLLFTYSLLFFAIVAQLVIVASLDIF